MATQDLLITNRDEIRKLCGKSKETVLQDIEFIKEWLKTQKHLPEIPTDNMIEFFLTNCKFSIEKTKQNLDMYYTVRSLLPEFYHNIHPCSPENEDIYTMVSLVTLPKLSPKMERVTLIKYKDSDKMDLRKIHAHYMSNMYEVRAQEDLVMGDIYIADVKHLSFATAAKYTPLLLKQLIFILEKVHSFRMKGIYIYNAPHYLNNILNLFKSIVSKKLSERIHSYPTIENIGKDFPLEMLPSDYGGKEKSLEELQALWKAKLFEYKDRLDHLEKIKVNEDLRPEKLKNDEVLGYYGNFKKLDTD